MADLRSPKPAHVPYASGISDARRLVAAAVGFLMLTGLLWPWRAFAQEEPPSEEAFPFVGAVNLSDQEGNPISPGTFFGMPVIDAGLRRLVLAVDETLFQVDVDTLEQVSIIDAEGAFGGSRALDDESHRMFFADSRDGNSSECRTDIACRTDPRTIKTFSLTESFEPASFTFPIQYGGHGVVALSYDSNSKRLYAVTFTKECCPVSGLPVPSRATLHALDARKLSDDPTTPANEFDPNAALLWSYRMESCGEPVGGGGLQSYLGVGSTGGFVYLACRGIGDSGTGLQATVNGVVLIELNEGSPGGAEFFPFAAPLDFGFSFGDQEGDRIVVVPSGGRTNRLYVFDALHRSWTGAVPMSDSNMLGGAVDASTSRLYVLDQGGGDAKVVVTDGSSVPVDQGQIYSLGVSLSSATRAHPAFDPGTRRLFISGIFPEGSLRVYEDRVPVVEKIPPRDPDEDTHPPEIPGRTPIAFSGLASAYGAREIFVGGRRVVLGDVDPSGTEQNFFAWVKRSLLDSTVSRAEAIRSEYQDADDDPDPPPVSTASVCRDETGDAERVSNPGSSVSCDLDMPLTTASAISSQEDSPSQSPVGVSSSYSTVKLSRDPVLGMVAEGEAVARGINIGGVISIGEVRVTATAVAKGALGTARSTFVTTIKDFVNVSPGGLSCGIGNDICDPNDVAAEINRTFQGRIQAQVPKRDESEDVSGSDGGAQAIVIRDPYYFWSEKNVNDDDQQEVPGLQLTIYSDQREASRQVIQFAAVLLEAHYTIGLPGEEPLPETSALRIQVTDDSKPAKPLAGGAFEVYADDNGDKIVGLGDSLIDEGTCVTEDDGIGNCDFALLTPGDYVIREAKAPKGYFPSSDLGVELLPGFRTDAGFVNPRAVGDVEVTLTDESSNKLSGGAFELYADNGNQTLDADDQKVGSCTTDENGFCAFPDASLNSYLLHQTAAPAGYVKSDDIPFALSEPGQKAKVTVVNGREGTAGTPATPDQPGTPGSTVPESTVVIEGGSGSAQTQVAQAPIDAAEPNLLLRVVRLPADALQFLLRNPLQALLFGILWLLLGLPLWMARRRRLGWLVAHSANVA